ncbi:3-hydroxyacyl-CoA dehydrogenase family protein [Rhodococcus qingshengii]|uniref:3-hydroxyacyl-CoA dehydrogenase family protein n=1 Tax=Rhodococcus qingshengii TaxID=334542 RepID=UPI001BE9C9FD|nr:3-hydroxyacyl-CoA dehydrogenase family protein [Rhodococcus qingshengii]MBT2271365.1 3-hydroxyacyl-CoA dehydrogenase family protein [Rhodococcus qingshengii]
MNCQKPIGVFGGGRMGAGIAHAFLLAGVETVVVEANTDTVDAARQRVERSVRRAAERSGSDSSAVTGTLDRLTVTTDPTALRHCELVIEAVPEIPDLKAEVLARIEEIATDAVLATNTSSLSVDGLAADLSRPNLFIGLHFFNPVPASNLVEIVLGAATDSAVADRARSWVDALGKTSITVSDSPGFASSRLGVCIALEAMRMLESRVASAEDIDTAMTLGYKHPVGPLRTTDIVGLDVRLAIAEHLANEVGPHFEPPRILREKVAAGDLGRKSGRGFFTW